MLALILVEVAQVVDDIECRGIIRAPYFLVSIQRPSIYLFRLRVLALIGVEKAQVIEYVDSFRWFKPMQYFHIIYLLYISVNVGEQPLLQKPVSGLWMTRYRGTYNRQRGQQ